MRIYTYVHACIRVFVHTYSTEIQTASQPGRQPTGRTTYKVDLGILAYLHKFACLHISTCSLYIYIYTYITYIYI